MSWRMRDDTIVRPLRGGRGTPATLEPWVNTDTAAAHLGKPPSWLRDNVIKLGIPHRKLGNQYRYRLSEIDAWIEEACL
jgi:hypothetical protein